jgi:hypothetical protein
MLLFSLSPIASPAAANPTGLFETIEFQTASLAAVPKWRDVLERIEAERLSIASAGAIRTAARSARFARGGARSRASATATAPRRSGRSMHF